jgi:hypothetical protein
MGATALATVLASPSLAMSAGAILWDGVAASAGPGATPATTVVHAPGWSDSGTIDTTITVTVDEDGKGSATVIAPVTATSKGKAFARKAPQEKVTYSDLVAWVNETPAPDEPDEGPQPDSDGIVTFTRPVSDKAVTSGGNLPVYSCAQLDASDDDVHMRTCSNYALKYKANGHSYFGTKGVGSAWSTDDNCFDCDRITRFANQNSLGAQGVVYGWAPSNSGPVGPCSTRTVATTASAGGVTATASDTQTVCPETYGLYGPALSTRSSGSFWSKDGGDTVPKDQTRGAHFVQLCDWNRNAGDMSLTASGTVWWS